MVHLSVCGRYNLSESKARRLNVSLHLEGDHGSWNAQNEGNQNTLDQFISRPHPIPGYLKLKQLLLACGSHNWSENDAGHFKNWSAASGIRTFLSMLSPRPTPSLMRAAVKSKIICVTGMTHWKINQAVFFTMIMGVILILEHHGPDCPQNFSLLFTIEAIIHLWKAGNYRLPSQGE